MKVLSFKSYGQQQKYVSVITAHFFTVPSGGAVEMEERKGKDLAL